MRFFSPSTKLARAMVFSARLDSRWCTRGLHKRRALLYKLEDGLGEFLPPPALKSIAVDWHGGLLERLNDEIKDTEDDGHTLAKTVIGTAGHEDKALAFNYASLALNNGFFLDHLKPPPPPPEQDHSKQISTELGTNMRFAFGGIAQFKSEFSAAAMGMFTSGWVWLVSNRSGHLAILPTYGPGTLLVRSQTYMAHAKGLSFGDYISSEQEVEYGFEYESGDELNISDPSYIPESSSPSSSPARSATPQPSPPGVTPSSPLSGVAGSRDPAGRNPLHPRFYSTTEPPVDNDTAASIYGEEQEEPVRKTDLLDDASEQVLLPLFCVSVHEHAWMSAGYGVWGKEEWLRKFWTVLDWEKVSNSYGAIIAKAPKHRT